MPIGVRNQAILFVLLDTGIRCSELVQLSIEDLDLEEGRIRVLHAKGNKQRVVSFALPCQKALDDYISLRGPSPGPLFVAASRHGQLRPGVALEPNGLKQMLRRLGRLTGIPKVHAHRFRHTFATWAIEQDVREPDVQYVLGHCSPFSPAAQLDADFTRSRTEAQLVPRPNCCSASDTCRLPSTE